jgi:hypothetical protein
MAQLLDRKPEDQQEDEEFISLEEVEEVEQEAEEPTLEDTQEPEEDDGIPDKYRGKDIKDIVQMHQEAEKLLGRQSSEVGELRKIVDDFVKSQIQAASSPQQEPDEEIDFFSDPEKAIARAIENHPKLRQAEETSMAMRQQQILAQLQNNHPDFINIIQDQKFQDWKESTAVRRELYERADKQFDYEAANELLVLWKERQGMVTETAKVQEQDRKRQLKAASTGSTTGSTESPSRKIYRRADIIKLMQTDPKRYTQLQPEIMAAYAEGRVK